MFDEILINPRTAAKLTNYLADPAQALLLVGPPGSGKNRLARVLAAQMLGVVIDKIDDYAHFIVIDLPKDKRDIPIESIRELIKKLRLQVPGKNSIRRVVLIENAHLMNHQAQNAFLKALEEPAPGTIYLMSAHTKNGLLATILSRTASISVDPVELALAREYFKEYSEADVAAAWALSQGAAGLLESLLSGEDSQLKQAVERAKTFLSKTPYERLLELDAIKDKAELASLLDGLARVFKALYRAAAQRQDSKRTKALTHSMQAVLDAQEALSMNVLPRLVVMKLILDSPV